MHQARRSFTDCLSGAQLVRVPEILDHGRDACSWVYLPPFLAKLGKNIQFGRFVLMEISMANWTDGNKTLSTFGVKCHRFFLSRTALCFESCGGVV